MTKTVNSANLLLFVLHLLLQASLTCSQECQGSTTPTLVAVAGNQRLSFHIDSCTHHEAEKACKRDGATLVTVTTEIANKLSNYSAILTQACHWTSGVRPANGNWAWNNGTIPISTTSSYWMDGSPRKSDSMSSAICQNLNNTKLRWIDSVKTRKANYICQREAAEEVTVQTNSRTYGSTILFFENATNYYSANATCASLDAHLVDDKTQKFHNVLRSKISDWLKYDTTITTLSFWSGGHNTGNSSWLWNDGTAVNLNDSSKPNYNKWKFGYPVYYNGSSGLYLYYYKYRPTSLISYNRWYNSPTSTELPFICQRDIVPCVAGNTCSANATCHNNFKTYTCACLDGFVGDGFTCESTSTTPSPTTATAFTTAVFSTGAIVPTTVVNPTTAANSIGTSLAPMLYTNTAGNPTQRGNVAQFLDQLKLIDSSNSPTSAEVVGNLSALINSKRKQKSQISVLEFKVINQVVSSLLTSQSNSNVSDPQLQNNVIKLISGAARAVQVDSNSTVISNTTSFYIEVSEARKLVFHPTYMESHSGHLQPVKVILPNDIFETAVSAAGGGGQGSAIAYHNRSSFILYKNSSIFPSTDNISTVVSAEVGRDDLRKVLKTPVSISFRDTGAQYGKHKLPNNTQQVLKTTLRCVSWDFNTSKWSSVGCFLNLTSNPPECVCQHLTNFAIIVTSEHTMSDVALEIVSTIGSILSIIGLICTIAVNLYSREARQRRATKLILHVCFNLLVVYILFLAGVSQTSNKIACDVVSILLHYFLLTSWCWMAIYSYDLYFSIVKVFLRDEKKPLLTVAIIGYGVPAFIVAITAGITLGYVDQIQPNHLYNSVTDPLLISSYRSDTSCWLRNYSLYFGFLLPVGIMLMFNIFVFISICVQLTCKARIRQLNSSGKRTSRMNIWIALTMTSMMGITWLLGYFILITRLPLYVTIMSWLFAIFNTLQGLSIFLLTVVRRSDLCKVWAVPLCNCLHRRNDHNGRSNQGPSIELTQVSRLTQS